MGYVVALCISPSIDAHPYVYDTVYSLLVINMFCEFALVAISVVYCYSFLFCIDPFVSSSTSSLFACAVLRPQEVSV